jgi:hypothetical protein
MARRRGVIGLMELWTLIKMCMSPGMAHQLAGTVEARGQ